MKRFLSIVAVAMFVATSAAATRVKNVFDVSDVQAPARRAKAAARPGFSGPVTRYRSRASVRKVVVEANNREVLNRALDAGAFELADYGSFRLLAIEQAALDDLDQQSREAANDPVAAFAVRDDFNLLLLRSGVIDTTEESTPGNFLGLGRASESPVVAAKRAASPSRMRLLQFVGPVKQAWLDRLRASGLEPVAYVPNNGYLVRGDSRTSARLLNLARSGERFVQWEGEFEAQHKIHPELVAAATDGGEHELTVAIQVVRKTLNTDPREETDINAARSLASSVIGDAYAVLNFANLKLTIAAGRLEQLAALPNVVNIEPWSPPRTFDERADQIVAGNLTGDGKSASAPGYMSWLASHGFNSLFNFALDVTDTGLDRGSIAAADLHPDFLDGANQSRVVYARDYTSDLDPGDVPGHGTINLSIAGGANTSSAQPARDSDGFSHGLGVAPFVLLGSSKIFQSSGKFDLIEPYTKLVSEAYRDGARVSSNSWGFISNSYTLESQEYDLRVRDAAPGQPGNQEIPIFFSAGNAGPGRVIGSPSTAKNVISVAAGENSRKGGTDGCFVENIDADSALDIAYFSSGGPLDDGRIKPDIAAPGTHVQGAASQHPDFDGGGVCGLSLENPYFPENQTLYTWSSGTSHSTPVVAGAAALVRQFFLNRGDEPSAALIKALLLNTTTYMTGEGAGGDLPHARQGWGLLNLNRTFDSASKMFVNQTHIFGDSGQQFVITGEVKDSALPFRVTLAWTDAPGFSGFASWVNDLDLEVSINGQVYRGNHFAGQDSQPGADPDTRNNVEAVWLPAGTVGTFVIRVRATNIAGDGVPGNLDFNDQDFAMVVYNGEKKDAPVATIAGFTLAGGADSTADPGETIQMSLSLGDLSPIALTAAQATLTSNTAGVTVTQGSASFPTINEGQTAQGSAPFAFTVASNVACGSTISFSLAVTSQQFLSRIPFSVSVGNFIPFEQFTDDIEAGEAKWTHGSLIKKKKKRVDTWRLSGKRARSGGTSWFTPAPGDKVTDAFLSTVPITLPSEGRNLQLIFYHTFEFERFAFDGGVIEISTGGAFEDLGSKILVGGYTGTLFPNTENPLAGSSAWVEGRLGAFQQVVVDLSSYAGKTVMIRFRVTTDSSVRGLGWYIDDVSLRGDRAVCSP